MADSTLRKYIWLINTILDAGKLTFREISEKWNNSSLNYNGTELSKRTFHNHRMAILTELGVDIQCSSKRENSQYYIANQDEIEKNDVLNWLTDSMATEQLLLENYSRTDSRRMRMADIAFAGVEEQCENSLPIHLVSFSD